MRSLFFTTLILTPALCNADVFSNCQTYVDNALSYMKEINSGKSVGDLSRRIKESDIDDYNKEHRLASLKLAAKFNYLNVGKGRGGYDFVSKNGMAACIDAGDATKVVFPN